MQPPGRYRRTSICFNDLVGHYSRSVVQQIFHQKMRKFWINEIQVLDKHIDGMQIERASMTMDERTDDVGKLAGHVSQTMNETV